MIAKGADIHIETLASELAALQKAVANPDPAQAFMAVSRVLDSGKMEAALTELRGIRQAETGVLESLQELLQEG